MSRTKQGNFLPFFTVDIPDEAEFASALSQALRTELRQHRSWANVVERWTGANERTAKELVGRANGAQRLSSDAADATF